MYTNFLQVCSYVYAVLSGHFVFFLELQELPPLPADPIVLFMFQQYNYIKESPYLQNEYSFRTEKSHFSILS